MAAKSNIEWTGASWTPIRARNLRTGKVGWHCEHATTGCEFCYAEDLNKWVGTGFAFKPGHRKDIEIFLDDEMLLAPLRWKKSRKIFVCSMTDLFADFVEDDWLHKIVAIMGACEDRGLGHTFQVLTKRPARMLQWMRQHGSKAWNGGRIGPEAWPARNLWAGVSCERQQEADERIPLLLQTPAAVRFISAEPLLGPIDLHKMPFTSGDPRHHFDALTGQALLYGEGINGNPDMTIRMEKPTFAKLDWVIVGGESGPHARPFHLTWAESLIDQCETAGVACFVKQLGACAISDGYPMHYADRKGGDWDEWPDALRVRQFPEAEPTRVTDGSVTQPASPSHDPDKTRHES